MSGWIVFNFTLLTILYGLFAKPLDEYHEMIEVEMLPTNIATNPRKTADKATTIAVATNELPLLSRKKRDWYWNQNMYNFLCDMVYYRKYLRRYGPVYRSKYSVWDLSRK